MPNNLASTIRLTDADFAAGWAQMADVVVEGVAEMRERPFMVEPQYIPYAPHSNRSVEQVLAHRMQERLNEGTMQDANQFRAREHYKTQSGDIRRLLRFPELKRCGEFSLVLFAGTHYLYHHGSSCYLASVRQGKDKPYIRYRQSQFSGIFTQLEGVHAEVERVIPREAAQRIGNLRRRWGRETRRDVENARFAHLLGRSILRERQARNYNPQFVNVEIVDMEYRPDVAATRVRYLTSDGQELDELIPQEALERIIRRY